MLRDRIRSRCLIRKTRNRSPRLLIRKETLGLGRRSPHTSLAVIRLLRETSRTNLRLVGTRLEGLESGLNRTILIQEILGTTLDDEKTQEICGSPLNVKGRLCLGCGTSQLLIDPLTESRILRKEEATLTRRQVVLHTDDMIRKIECIQLKIHITQRLDRSIATTGLIECVQVIFQLKLDLQLTRQTEREVGLGLEETTQETKGKHEGITRRIGTTGTRRSYERILIRRTSIDTGLRINRKGATLRNKRTLPNSRKLPVGSLNEILRRRKCEFRTDLGIHILAILDRNSITANRDAIEETGDTLIIHLKTTRSPRDTDTHVESRCREIQKGLGVLDLERQNPLSGVGEST